MEFSLKYGRKTQTAEIDNGKLLGFITPKYPLECSPDTTKTIETAIRNPIGTTHLKKMISRGNKVTIVVDDHTRSTPTHAILP